MIDLLIDKRMHDLGGGFTVGRVLPFARHRMVGPFVFFDHAGPVDLPARLPKDFDVRPHPHIGIATVTYLFDGAITHRDSLGTVQEIRPGEVNWMVAGRGIVHSERFEHIRTHGGRMHAIQSWVALPDGDEEGDPAFYHIGADDMPTWREDGVECRLIAGDWGDKRSPVPVASRTVYMHWEIEEGAQTTIASLHPERAIYVAAGAVEIAGTLVSEGQMAVLSEGEAVPLTATRASTVMVLGGMPVGPRFIAWNFVASSKERLERAMADWQEGRFPTVPGDAEEFIPLPEQD